MTRAVVAGCLVVVPMALLLPRWLNRPDPLPALPRLMLWAWESPQDLRFVMPGKAGIAFLARTVWLDGDRVRSRPRLQPLRYTPGTDLMAVIRFESQGRSLPATAGVVREVMTVSRIPEVRAIQVDFDARASERAWYTTFLRDLRRALPERIPLTITALESWCEEGRWVRTLPVADATAMLFRLGPGERVSTAGFPAAICSSSVGVSTDELPARIPRAHRIFFFTPGPWTRQAYDAAAAQAWRWWR
jgi:Protein of unknown function (DUF3142)